MWAVHITRLLLELSFLVVRLCHPIPSALLRNADLNSMSAWSMPATDNLPYSRHGWKLSLVPSEAIPDGQRIRYPRFHQNGRAARLFRSGKSPSKCASPFGLYSLCRCSSQDLRGRFLDNVAKSGVVISLSKKTLNASG